MIMLLDLFDRTCHFKIDNRRAIAETITNNNRAKCLVCIRYMYLFA